MKNFLWFFMAIILFAIPFAAEAQFPTTPKSRSGAVTQNTQAQVQPPTPTPVQAAPPVVNVAPPNVSVMPQLVAPPTSTMDEIKSWLMVTFGGLIAALLAKIGFRPAPTPVPGSVTEPTSILLALRDKVTDPDTRARIDQTLLTVLGTGVPSKLVQTGLGLVPGAGPILSGAEPLLHNAFMGFLKDRLEGNKS